ncbi:MAG: small multi-drug export protein, partial [Oscillospiraceae bacterium]
MTAFFATYFGKLVATVGMALLPVIELRGAIPYGVALGLSPWDAFFASILGNMLPVPIVILLLRQVFDWLRKTKTFGPMIEALERKAHLKGRIVQKYRLPGLALLVAIPLPGTGAWTGALVAVVLNIRLRQAFPAIFAGVVAAGLIVLT